MSRRCARAALRAHAACADLVSRARSSLTRSRDQAAVEFDLRSRPDRRSGRCRRAAAQGGSSRAPGAWTGARAGRVRPAACLRGSCARCAKMSRISVGAIDHLDLERALEVALLRGLTARWLNTTRSAHRPPAAQRRVPRPCRCRGRAPGPGVSRRPRSAAGDRQRRRTSPAARVPRRLVGSSDARGAASADLHTDQNARAVRSASRRLDLKRSQARPRDSG